MKYFIQHNLHADMETYGRLYLFLSCLHSGYYNSGHGLGT